MTKSLLLTLIIISLTAIIGETGCSSFETSLPELTIPADASETEKLGLVDQWFHKLHEINRFNGGILIAREGKPLLLNTYGFTDYQKNKPLTSHSAFRLASLSKQFTAAGIMLLQSEGKLAYDDPVEKYLSDFPYPGTTIRHLLQHTSGVPDLYMKLSEDHREEIGEVLSIEEVVQLMTQYPSSPDSEPNQKMAYSNTGYVLLAGIIEKISGQSFEAYMQTALFTPLGMEDSRIWNLLSADSTFANKTEGIKRHGKNRRAIPSYLDGVAGDGAVFASLHDFLIWDQFWYRQSLLSESAIEEAFQPAILLDGSTSNYGFGWGLSGNVVSHTGGWLAARTFIERNTVQKTCLVVLENGANPQMEEIVNTVKALSF